MAVNPYTEARARANRAFDEKTYKKVLVSLRYDEDGDMIKALEEAQADQEGMKAEILAGVQKLFGSQFVFAVSFSSIMYQ